MDRSDTRRSRLKAALRLARYRVAQHTDKAWITYPEGSQSRSVFHEETVTLPVADVNLMIKMATRELTRCL